MNIVDVRIVVPLAEKVFTGSGHCCAHIVMDDPNYSNDDAQHCLERAIERGHKDCVALCEVLVACSQTQRRKLSKLAWNIAKV